MYVGIVYKSEIILFVVHTISLIESDKSSNKFFQPYHYSQIANLLTMALFDLIPNPSKILSNYVYLLALFHRFQPLYEILILGLFPELYRIRQSHLNFYP